MHGTDVAVGTACAINTTRLFVPQSGEPSSGTSCAGRSSAIVWFTANPSAATRTTARPTRRTLHRCSEIGGRDGASARNCSSRFRPSRFIATRSCVGLAAPRAAANASATSSGVNSCNARR